MRGPVLVGSAAMLAFVVALIVAAEVWNDCAAVQRWVPNAASEIAGLILTLIVVNELLEAARRRRLAPQKLAALRRLERALMDFVGVLSDMYKAASPADAARPETPREILDAWARAVGALDAYAEAPIAGKTSWLRYWRHQVEQLAVFLEDLTDRHAEALGVAIVAAAEDYLGSPLRRLTGQIVQIPDIHEQMNVKVGRLAIFEGWDDLLHEFAATLKRLIEAYEAASGSQLTTSPTWQDNVAPRWGDSRTDRPK